MSNLIQGISHLTFSVADLAASVAFYQQVFEAELLFSDEKTAYFDLAGLWLALNVQEGIARQEIRQSYTHVAFAADATGIAEMERRLCRLGIPLVPSRSRSSAEGLSVYFRDPDGHLLEVHAGDRKTRINAYYHEVLLAAEE